MVRARHIVLQNRCTTVRLRGRCRITTLLTALLATLFLLLATAEAARANTVLGTTGCSSSAARSIAAPAGGGVSMSSEDCTIAFGSSDGTAMLHAYQTDLGGTTLRRGSTGALDNSFSGDGRLEDDNSAGNDEYRGVAVQPDGKVVVAGVRGTGLDMYVRRYLPDGSLDPAFGVAGERLLVGTWDTRDLALAPDGSIFVLGYGGNNVVVAKLTSSGGLDPNWNNGTWASRNFTAAGGAGVAGESLTIGRGGEVYVAGYTPLPGEIDMAVLNFTADGRLDPTFDGDGLRIIDIGNTDEGRGIIEQADGRIVVAGLASMANGDAVVVRLLPDGQLDSTFDGDGIRAYPIGASNDYGRAVMQRPTGELLVSGYRRGATDQDPFVLQLLPNGTPDTSFAPGGIAVVTIAGTDDFIYDAALQPDGAVVMAGQHDQADDDLLFARITAGGVADPTFGSGSGYRFHSGGNIVEELRGVTVGPDGRIVGVGFSSDAGQEHADLLVLDIDQVADYATGTNDFGAGGNAFGACLRGTGGGALTTASTWTVSATCPLSTGAWWRGLPTGMGSGSKVATTTGSGVTDATASLRFGLELSGAEPAGSYQAPITIDVIAPNLDPPANTTVPTITGTAKAKLKLTATTGTWSGSATITYAYQWQRCTPGCVDIADATASTYYPVTADVGATLRVVVTATNSLGSATANSAQTASVAAASTLSAFYVTGFEHQEVGTSGAGVLNGYTGSGTNAPSTTTRRSGAAAMRFQGAASMRQWDVLVPAINTYRDSAARFYFSIPSYPSNTQTISEFESQTLDYCEIELTNTGQLQAALSGAATDPGPTIQTNRWYRIDYNCNFAGPSWQETWSVDGVDQGTLSAAAPNEYLQNFQIGIDTNSTMDITFDDVIATTAAADYPIGPGKVLAYGPSGTGAHATHASFDWTSNNGGLFTALTSADDGQSPGTAQYLDDWPTNVGGGADFVRQKATAGNLEYQLADTSETAPINAVSLLVAGHDSGAGLSSIVADLDAGSGYANTINVDPPSTVPSFLRGVSSTVPVAGGPWTAATFNATKVRLNSTDVTSNPRYEALLAEVDFASIDPPVNLATPIVSGVPRVGRVLSTTNGSWTPIGGLTFTYQWQNCAPACTDIAGATNSTYTLVAGDLGDTVRVRLVASNAGGSQSSVSNATTAVGSAAPTLTVFDGFESGELNPNGNMYQALPQTNGTIGVDATWARTGAYSGRVVSNGGAGSTSIGYPLSGTIAIARVSMRLENLIPGGARRELVELQNPDASNCEVNYNPGTGRIEANISGSNQMGPIAEAGRWYDIDVFCNSTTGTRRLEWMVDGVAQTPVTRAVATNPFDQFSIGNTLGGTTAYVANFDDVAVSQTTADYPLGNIAVEGLAPQQSGTHQNAPSFGISTDGGASWAALTAEDDALPGSSSTLDEYPAVFTPGTSGDILRQTVANDYLEYRIADSDRADPPISVRALGTHSAATPATAQNARLIASLGGSTSILYTQDPGDPSNSRWTWNGLMNTRPGGGVWTAADIDNLRVRLSSTNIGGAAVGERPWTHNLLVEAAFPSVDGPEALTAPQIQQPWQSVKVGDLLEADPATWTDPIASRTWQWLRCPTSSTCTPIPGATGQAYTVALADADSTIQLAETASNAGGRQTVRSSAPTALVATQPTIVMATGFEGGSIASSTDGIVPYGAPTFGTSTVRSGLRALASTDLTTSDGLDYSLSGGTQAAVTRAYVRVPVASPSSANSILDIATTGPTRSCDIDVNPGGGITLELFDGSGRDTQSAGLTIQANRWYLVEMRLTTNAATWTCDWSIDGVRQIPSVWNFGAADTIDTVGIGAYGANTYVLHTDDWMVSTTASDFPLGPGRTVALAPDGEGTHATIASFASDSGALGANSQQRLDELPAWGITDWVSQTLTGSTSYLEWTMSNPSERSTSARAVHSIVGFHSSSALGNDGQSKVVRPGDTDAAAPVVQTGNMSFTSMSWTGAMVPAPAGGWTPSVLDQLRMRNGYAVDVSPAPRWEADMLELEYRE